VRSFRILKETNVKSHCTYQFSLSGPVKQSGVGCVSFLQLGAVVTQQNWW